MMRVKEVKEGGLLVEEMGHPDRYGNKLTFEMQMPMDGCDLEVGDYVFLSIRKATPEELEAMK